MLKTVDDKIFSIINRKLPLEKRFKKLTSNARNVLYTLIIKSKIVLFDYFLDRNF